MAVINIVVILFVMTSLSSMTSSAEKNVAKVRVYVDEGAQKHWREQTGKSGEKNFRTSIYSAFFEINEVFKSMKDNGVDLELQIDDVIFMKENILNTNNGQIGTDDSLKQFGNYVKPTYSKNQYDLAILYTGSELIGAYGYAAMGEVCSANAIGVVQYDETYTNALLTAHEIGHIFGSPHDGEGDSKISSRSCAPDGEVLNSVVYPNKAKHFFFSSCTAYNIKQQIDKLNKEGKNCLLKWDKSGEIKGPRMGQIMTADEACKRGQGKHTFVARFYSKPENTCLYLPCVTDIHNMMMMFESTPQGLSCGKNKQCIQGKCVETSEGSPDVSDTCPFGNQPELSDGKKCSDLSKEECISYRYAEECCLGCEEDAGSPGPLNADEVCKKLEGPGSALGRLYYKTYGDSLCSALRCLNDLEKGYFSASTHTAPNGMKCGKNKVCQDSKCVKSKKGDPNMSDTCPYGDQPWLGAVLKENCPDYVKEHGCNLTTRMKHMCCMSCA